MTKEIKPEDLLKITEEYMGRESHTYKWVKEMLDNGYHPKEAWMNLRKVLRDSFKRDIE